MRDFLGYAGYFRAPLSAARQIIVLGLKKEASVETIEYFRYEMINTLNRVWAGSEVEYFQRQAYVEQLMEAEIANSFS